MFTGIVETCGVVTELDHCASGLSLSVDTSSLGSALGDGASLCVNGVCLTAVRPSENLCFFDVIAETVRCTNFSDLRIGQRLNLEQSMCPDSRFDGHFVQGHVDAVAAVDRVVDSALEQVLWLEHEDSIRPLIVPKGAVAINGVSLTVAAVDGPRFSVALIPTTLERTNLSQLRPGDRVNVETDILARTIYHQLKAWSDGGAADQLLSKLRQEGYA